MSWAREQAGVDIGKLFINDLGVAWVLAIGDRCGDERVLVLDTGRLCKVDHFVRVVLSVADASCRKECVDAGDIGQVDTWVAGEDVATTRELCVEYILLSAFCF